MTTHKDIIIVGGGAAGMSAAINAYDQDLDLLIIERDQKLGGILNQCIHNGFGLHVFKKELTGPEYAQALIDDIHLKDIPYLLDTSVLDIEKKDNQFVITLTNTTSGEHKMTASAVILTTGCYERARGHIDLLGERPQGIMTAGSAQRYLNIDGYLVGKKVFILGSGDIGLIMARRMTLEGAHVLGVAELMPYSNGLTRNVVQCLEDFDIPLYLSHTVKKVIGHERLEKVIIQQVDDNRQFIEGTEKTFEIDTLLLSIGLIPDVKLFDHLSVDLDVLTKSAVVDQRLQTSVDGLFVSGNALHVHDLVDEVTIESKKAGQYAKAYVKDTHQTSLKSKVIFDQNIHHVVPQFIDFNHLNEPFELLFRTKRKYQTLKIEVNQKDQMIYKKTLKYVVPAEMQKLTIKPEYLISKDPINIKIMEDSL